LTAIPAAILAVVTPPKRPPSDRRYELILRSEADLRFADALSALYHK